MFDLSSTYETTHQNDETVEDLVCSKEDQPGTFMQPKDTEKLNISHFFVSRIIKTKGIKQFKHLKHGAWMMPQGQED